MSARAAAVGKAVVELLSAVYYGVDVEGLVSGLLHGLDESIGPGSGAGWLRSVGADLEREAAG